MGDMGDLFNAEKPIRKQMRRERRDHNQTCSIALLRSRGIEFESKNNGHHLVIRRGPHAFDFWPTGGIWHYRTPKKTVVKGRGVFKLLAKIASVDRTLDTSDKMP